MNHALKIEDLGITEKKADSLRNAIYDFMVELGFSTERIEALECRSRDGFIPYRHNKGGLQAAAHYDMFYAACNGTGFKNTDATLNTYYDNAAKELSAHDLNVDKNMDELQEWFGEDSVLFSLDVMFTGVNEVNLRFCICAKDSPYHRQYDDLIDMDITFKNVTDLKAKLKKVLKNKQVALFSRNLADAY